MTKSKRSKALVRKPVDRCPQCGAWDLFVMTVVQPSIVRHGGYGASRRTRMRSCRHCDWSIIAEVCEERP